jgi:hypothetical protein
MRIVEVRERTLPISRYADPAVPSGGLTTSAVAVITDVIRSGRPVIGYGFGSIGRFAQGGLIRERFAGRLLAAREADLVDQTRSNLDPFRAWRAPRAGSCRRTSSRAYSSNRCWRPCSSVVSVKATGRALERTLYSTSPVISVSPKVVSSAPGLGPPDAGYSPLIRPASMSKRLKRRASDPQAASAGLAQLSTSHQSASRPWIDQTVATFPTPAPEACAPFMNQIATLPLVYARECRSCRRRCSRQFRRSTSWWGPSPPPQPA